MRLALTTVLLVTTFAQADDALFRDGDLVVLLGGTLIERAQEYGHIEAAIRLANPDKKLHVRNLGWSGDTVWAESRGEFDPPSKGYERMIEQITEMQPNVIIFGYGNAESFNGSQGVESFKAQFRKLVHDLPEARRVFLSPVLPKTDGNESESLAARSAAVIEYSSAVEAVAKDFAARFVDVTLQGSVGDLYDRNGMHLNGAGYGAIAHAIFPGYDFITAGSGATAPEQLSELLGAIVAKNRLVFYRWRPQNITYLALFRKHEQGNNYAEIPMFDPLIDEADQSIDRLARDIAGLQGSGETGD